MAEQGRKAVLQMAPGGLASGTLTTISGKFSGLETFDKAITEDERAVPGGGPTIHGLLDYKEGTSGFTVDDNETTRELLWMSHATRAGFRYYRTGLSGSYTEFDAFVTLTVNLEERGAQRYTVALDIETEPVSA